MNQRGLARLHLLDLKVLAHDLFPPIRESMGGREVFIDQLYPQTILDQIDDEVVMLALLGLKALEEGIQVDGTDVLDHIDAADQVHLSKQRFGNFGEVRTDEAILELRVMLKRQP